MDLKKKVKITAVILMALVCLFGVGVSAARTYSGDQSDTGTTDTGKMDTGKADAGKTDTEKKDAGSGPDGQTPSLLKVMDRILVSQELKEAVNYQDGIEDTKKDTIVLLCRSESGKYEAYGFFSKEYGKDGILINNNIEGRSNWNYFEEAWSYGDTRPTLEEKGEYEVLFTFTQGENEIREVYFDTYDTGTMSAKNEQF